MRELQLTQNQVTIVSDEIYERVIKYKWYAWLRPNGNYYAMRNMPNCNSNQPLANFIMEVPNGIIIDHVNGNTLDNQCCNLRVATKAQNVRNQGKQARSTSSQYKGVSLHIRNGKWQAGIRVDGKKIYLGYFLSERVAALAYDVAARKYFGEFARLNFP